MITELEPLRGLRLEDDKLDDTEDEEEEPDKDKELEELDDTDGDKDPYE